MTQTPENQQQYGSILTILGENAEQNGKLQNKQITFTHMAIGDANDEYVQPDRKQTALVNELARIPVNSVDVLQPTPDSVPMLKVEAILPDDVNDLVIREFAAVATFDGNTYFHAVGNNARIYVPPPVNNGNVSTPVTLEMIFVITSADPIVEIDPNVVTASREWTGNNFVGKKGATKGRTVRPIPGNEKETEWYRPGLYDVSSYGDVSSSADDAFRDVREHMLSDGGGKMFMPSAKYIVSSPVIPDQSDTAGKFIVEGESQNSTTIETDQPIDVIVSRERLTMSRVKLSNTHADKVGRGVTTNDTKQSAVSIHRDSTIQGFRFGVWHRYSIWNEYRNLTLKDNNCGIRLSRHAYQLDNSNPEPTAGWNAWNNGWFHNALVLDNVYCEGGEVGIWGAAMCATFISCTTQGQRADGSSNDVLPNGVRGTGILLDCGSDTARKGWNNTIISHYCEFSDVAVHAIGQRYLGIDGLFMQGGSSSNRAQNVIVADNSFVMAKGVTGQDYFEDGLFKALNNSTVVLEGGRQGSMSGSEYNVDATSQILPRGQCDLDKNIYRIYKSLGVNDMTFTLPSRVSELSVMKLYIMGLYDGYRARNGECSIFNWNSSVDTDLRWHPKMEYNESTSEWEISDAPPPGISVSVSNAGVVSVTLSGSQSFSCRIIAQIVGGEDVSNTSLVLTGV